MEELVIIIPTHNRHSYLNRVLKYYSSFKYKFYICDSSREKFVVSLLPENCHYYYFPGCSFIEKTGLILENINCKYVVMSADDDFLVESTLDESVSFLNQHAKCCTVSGKQLYFSKTNEHCFWTNYSNTHRYLTGYLDGDKYVNAKKIFSSFQQILWSVYRVDVIKLAYEILNKSNFSNANFIELIMANTALYKGTIAFLNKPLNVREYMVEEHWGSVTPAISYLNMLLYPNIRTDIHKYYDVTSSYIDPLLLKIAMDAYLGKKINILRSFFYLLIGKMKKQNKNIDYCMRVADFKDEKIETVINCRF